MTYMDAEEAAGRDIWDKVQPRRRQPLPGSPLAGSQFNVQGAGAATRPRQVMERPKPSPGRPPMVDDSRGPPPPPRPRDAGQRRWDMNKKAPPQWQQERPPPRNDWQGEDSIEPDARDQADMMRGAYWAGKNGDTGAQGSFPNTPFGRRQREAYERGRREAAQAQR